MREGREERRCEHRSCTGGYKERGGALGSSFNPPNPPFPLSKVSPQAATTASGRTSITKTQKDSATVPYTPWGMMPCLYPSTPLQPPGKGHSEFLGCPVGGQGIPSPSPPHTVNTHRDLGSWGQWQVKPLR